MSEAVAVKKLVGNAGLPQEISANAAAQKTVAGLKEFLENAAKTQQTAFIAAQAAAIALDDPQQQARLMS